MIGAVEFGFALRSPWWLLVLPVCAFVLLVRSRRASRVATAALMGGPRLRLPWTPRRVARVLRPCCEVVGMLAVIGALARPVQRIPLPPERLGVDIVLCLDRSSSMVATDLAAARTRLMAAKDAAAAFVRGRPQDRIGLVQFARYADLVCPPTVDHAALLALLAVVEPVTKDGPEDATGIGTAVARAVETLARAGTAAKVVVLLTDGEENVATAATPREIAPLHAAQLAVARGVRVHTIAVGDGDGGRAPDFAAVERLATASGGRFFTAHDVAALGAIYREIDSLEKTVFVEPRVLVREWFPWLVAAAVGALLAAGFLGTGRGGVAP